MSGSDTGNSILQTPPTTSHSIDSTMQLFGDMDGFLKQNGYSPSEDGLDGAGQSLMASGMQLPMDFDMSLEPSVQDPNEYSGESMGSSTPAHFTGSVSDSQRSSPRPRFGVPNHYPSVTPREPESGSDHQAVITARECWSYFKCNPTSSRKGCPKTGRIHLDGLEQTLKNQDAWQHLMLLPEIVKPVSDRYSIKVDPFNSFTRDKLLAITQLFLHKATNTHTANFSNRHHTIAAEDTGFIVLPPPNTLELLLEAYTCHLDPHYLIVPTGLLDTNNLMRVGCAQTASLLLLLMIALGASAIPNVEARSLTHGLIEACRIPFRDVVEKNAELTEDFNVLRCGLLFTIAAVWSGDKWHMDVSAFCEGECSERVWADA